MRRKEERRRIRECLMFEDFPVAHPPTYRHLGDDNFLFLKILDLHFEQAPDNLPYRYDFSWFEMTTPAPL